ncbi:MAG: hypothetical protein GWN01_15695 [Nitrosopumilaceae archaeon]|nr:hypothetical protein [Nitrosopumilaceae archaeon]NIU88737.1 hypothetical protein [Nitrosopumilaceae archaeon]NIV66872.1 hypothetical protein [Nitrosopumilaceae archaeon]NIX62886.1 hypothetical protein [Nitrosopumilaceae archaeon]
MSPKEFLAKHEEVIKEVCKRIEDREGIRVEIIQQMQAGNTKKIVLKILNEVYSVSNNGEQSNWNFEGVMQ